MLKDNTSVAVMQPYIFPYIGYFQMIHAVDKFIFYDDVNFIKQGWINRNNLLIQNQKLMFTIPLKDSSSFSLIKDIFINENIYSKWKTKFFKTIEQSYKKAPYFKDVFPLIEQCFNSPTTLISELAIHSIKSVSNYLDISTNFETSSQLYAPTKELDRADRLIEICKLNGSEHYINAIGGVELYDKEYFKKNGIQLNFIQCGLTPYKQFSHDFTAGLSIIDVLMFNSKVECQNMLANYKLI